METSTLDERYYEEDSGGGDSGSGLMVGWLRWYGTVVRDWKSRARERWWFTG